MRDVWFDYYSRVCVYCGVENVEHSLNVWVCLDCGGESDDDSDDDDSRSLARSECN